MACLAEGDGLVTRKTDRLQEVGYDLGAVDGEHAERIAWFVLDPALLERQFEMASLLVRTFRHQVIDEELGSVGIILGWSVGQMDHDRLK